MTDATQAPQEEPASDKDQRGGMVGGIILTGIGFVLLLLVQDVIYWDQMWPLVLIIVGLALLTAALFNKKESPSDKMPSA